MKEEDRKLIVTFSVGWLLMGIIVGLCIGYVIGTMPVPMENEGEPTHIVARIRQTTIDNNTTGTYGKYIVNVDVVTDHGYERSVLYAGNENIFNGIEDNNGKWLRLEVVKFYNMDLIVSYEVLG